MFELKQAGERTYYTGERTLIGLYRLDETDICLIDTGNSDEDGAELDRIIREHGWNLKFIVNTHTHIDHLGGNAYLMERWKCPAYSTAVERAFAEYEILEPSYMYGGYPFREMKEFFRHPGELGFENLEQDTLPEGFSWIELPGHSFGMVGVKTPDQVWFLGDSVLDSRSLTKYQFGYLVDVQGYLDTLDLLESLDGKLFIPSHGDVVEDIRPLAAGNRENIRSVCDGILEDCREEKSFDFILKAVFDRYAIRLNPIQYAVIGSTLKCYLSYLEDQGKLERTFRENMLYWRTGNGN